MRINNWPIIAMAALTLALTGCGSSDAGAAQATRAATQTPFIIYVPVTTTPEPATPTALPTITPEATPRPTRTPTKAAAKPTATKVLPTQPPVAAGPSPTHTPACSLGSVSLIFPKDGDPRATFETHPGSDTFDFKWSPELSLGSDLQSGYQINITTRKSNGSPGNGDVVYVSQSKFMADGQHYVYDQRRVYNLPGGADSVTVFWNVTIVKTTGPIDDQQGKATGTVINCGPPSATWKIILEVRE